MQLLSDPRRLAEGPALAPVDNRILELLREKRPAVGDAAEPQWWQDIADIGEHRLSHLRKDDRAHASWTSMVAAAQLLGLVRERLHDLESYPKECFDRLCEDYLEWHDGDWRLDEKYHQLPPPQAKLPADWHDALVAPAREAYRRWVREQTRRFVASLAERAKYAAKGFLPQTSFWSECVFRAT
jgi:hypothetical protein